MTDIDPLEESTRTGLEVAVVGMAGRFPGARNIHEFWENLKNGTESITFFSDEELREVGIYSSFLESSNFVGAGGYLEGIEYFDAAFFGYTPAEAGVTDPQLRFLHECAWEALEDAGCDPDAYEGLIGVYVGASDNFAWKTRVAVTAGADGDQFAAFMLSNAGSEAARLSYQLNLTGPSTSVNSACSTSLVAIHRACRELLGGECDLALAGGVSISVPQKRGYLYYEGMMHSSDGHCRAFDAGADGTVPGDGVGVVILKRLEEAIEQGNHIYAVIKGSAVNNDGKRKVGYTAPSVEGQSDVIRAAYRVGEVDPDSIGYIETHGTGTTLGDPIEIKALVRGMDRSSTRRCVIGAVKTNIGHLDAASGAAAFIKTVLCLKYRMIPPTLHFKSPNPELELENTPFYIDTELMEWERQGNRPLRAGVNSFGIGGTNAHVILEEAPVIGENKTGKERQYHLLLLSAKTASALDKMSQNLAEFLRTHPDIKLADAAYSLQIGRKAFAHRQALVCSTVEEAIEALSKPGSPAVQSLISNEEFRHTVFMFAGQGNQYVNMGRELYETEPVFRKEMDRCFTILKPLLGYDIKEILYPFFMSDKSDRSDRSDIHQTEIARPLIFAFEYALAQLLMHWGITPDTMIGRGFGEYAAACLTGVFSLEHGLALAVQPGRSMQGLFSGGFSQNIQRLLKEKRSIFIEIGPGRDLTGLVKRYIDDDAPQPVIDLIQPPPQEESDMSYLLRQVGRLWLYRRKIDWKGFHFGDSGGNKTKRRLVPLPTYPFEQKRYWIDEDSFRAFMDKARGIRSTTGTTSRQILDTDTGADTKAGIPFRVIHQRPESDVPYAAPGNEIQQKLVEIWQEFFGLDRVGIDDDFFDLGGDSLKAAAIISRIHKELAAKISLAVMFANPTARELSFCIAGAEAEEFISIEAGEKKEYYILAPAQQRFYMMQRMAPGTTAFHMQQVIPLGLGVDKERVEIVFKRLIRRHESLRTAFVLVSDKPVQRVYDEVEFGIEYLAAENAKDREEIIKNFIRPFDLLKAPLLRVGLVETPADGYSLIVDIHHIISDGTSQVVLTGDFVSLYNGGALEPIRLHYRDFAQWQDRMLETGGGLMNGDRVFWLEHLAGKLPVLRMPTDFPRPRDRDYSGEMFTRSLGRELSREVNHLLRQTKTTLYMVLLTALNILLYRYTGQEDIIIGSPAAGRNHADLEKIVGLVIGTLMMRNFPAAEKPFNEFLHEVKERTLAAYEHQAYPFEELLKKLDYDENPARNPVSDVALIVQNMFPASTPGPATEVPGTPGVSGMPGVSKLDFTIYALEQGEEIVCLVEYSTALFRRRTMERLIEHLTNILKAAVKNPGIPAGEIDFPTAEEKRAAIGMDVPCYPLSHPQKRIYYTEKRYPHTAACTLSFTVRYNRLLENELLKEAVNGVLQRHEGLRLRIVEFDFFHDPFQYIAPYRRYIMEEVEVDPCCGLTEWTAQQSREPFDWINNDLFYFACLKFEEKESGYYMKFHHIAADGWTILALFKEIHEIYEALETGTPMELETAPSYIGFIRDENGYLNSPRARQDRDFWHRYLLPLPGRIELSAGVGNDPGAGIEASACVLEFPAPLRAQLHRYCKANKTSIFKLLLSALSVYIRRVTGNRDFVIAGANHNRTAENHRRMAGMFVSTVPFRINMDDKMGFGDFAAKTGIEVDYILKNRQAYPFNRLMDELREETGVDVGYLLAVNLVGHPDVEEDKYRIEHHFPGYEPTPLTIHINNNHRDIHGILECEWDYQLRQYAYEDIERIHRGLVNILTDALMCPTKELWQIEWLSEEEKEQVIDLFNRSGTVEAETFSPDKPLHVLFAEQAERTPDHVALTGPKLQITKYKIQTKYKSQITKNNQSSALRADFDAFGEMQLTYKELNEQSSRLAHFLIERGVLADDIIGIMVERSIEMIIGILGILKAGGAYLPIDQEYPQERIDYILKDSGAKFLLKNLPEGHLIHHSSNQYIIHHSNLLAYVIYTSGSTGRPKGVAVTHRNVVAYLNAFDRQFALQPADIVVQQASYAFDAFVEEMYPVLLKGGVLAIPSQDEVVDIQRLVNFLIRHRVTVITCSPLMLSQLNRLLQSGSIHTFISGGDRLKPDHINNLLKIGKVFNTYGPTETTVCATYYRAADSDRAAIPIGKPIPGYRVYILDAHLQPVPVGVNGELCIAGAGVTQGYLNKPEMTIEKFFYRSYGSYGTYISYRTGDLGRWLPDGNIEFIGRVDSQVKIRGFRIELGEIENQLLKIEAVKEAVVIAREEQGEPFLCAYIVIKSGETGVNTAEIKTYLSHVLPAYMVPAFFVPVESIPLTINGKPDLEALPDPLSKRLDEYEPPADRVEEELVTLWSEVLNIPRGHIGVTANFFDLGGHSLKATLLTAHIHKKLDVELSLAEVFKFPNIKELSGIIRVKAKHAYTFIEPLEKKEYYPLSSAQKRLYFLQQMDLNSTAYNMSLVLLLGKDIDKDGLENTLKKLIRRHEGLRTSFEVVKGEPVQRIHDEAELEIEYYNFRIPKILQEFVRPFDLSKAPLIRSGLIKTHDGNYTWLVDIHHIVSDGTSHTVLAEDFAALYREEELEPLRLHYKDFSGWQNRLFASGKIKNQEDYWLGLYAGEIPRLHMPADYRRPEVFTFAGAHYYFALPGEDGLKFKTLASRHGGTLYMNILAALNTLCYKYTGQTDIIIGSGIAGRPHADLQRIIGMFVNTLAMRNYPAGEKTYESFLEEVIAHSVEAFENQDVQFEELVERLDPERDPSRNPLFDISMVVQNFRRINEVVAIRNEDDGEKPDRVEGPPLTTTKFDLTFFIVESGGNDNVYFDVEYYTGIFKEETVKRLANHFGNIVKTVVNNPSVMLKDIDIISEDEKKQVLGEFNDTERDYPCHKTIHRLFAEQMEKTPDHTAVISRGQGNISVTYRELNEKSGRLAGYLYYEKHIRPEEPVGISMSEPIELAVGILGILKSGAAYVPLDPSLPEERLKYMIDDSRTGMVVSEKRYIKTLERLQWQCNGFHSYLCMDSRDIEGEWEVEHSELMDEELWNHVAETGEDEITRGGWLSSYTGLPFSRLEMDEYGDNIFKKLEPLLNPEMRVLEIGCASGITMYRIAPKVGLYYGTDLSPVMIDGNKKKTAEQGQQNIKLSCLAAHEIDRIEERNFDLVIMNSVIQCFHGHHYLRKVLKKAIDLLGEKGFLFLGDIMDQEKKDVLIRELETFKSTNPDKGYNTKTDFSSELFISRGFWEDFGVESGVIEDICFSDKLHTVENELTGFRYDVLITVNKSIPGGGWKKWRKQKYREDGTGLLEFSGQRPPPLAASNNLAYIIYTSGTTGQPKGVEVEHCAAVNTLCCRKVEYGMNSQCTALQLFSYGFDGFVTGFFTPLISGARLIVLPAEELGDVDQIKASILKNSVTHFICVPPLYSALLESMTGEELSTLKAVTLAGDRVSAALVARTKEKYEHIEIINEYGVTEAAVMSTIYRGQDGDNTVKIGHPVWNTQIFILDEGERLQPVGVPGELCISGVGLARGYLNKPELTAERFVDYRSYRTYRTYRTYISSKKIYKTGDRARWLSEGNIEFLGRIDHQVKIRGFRIEMGEIESLLLKHESIKEVVVIDRENEQGDKYLCAYIKVGGAFKLNHAELKEYLSRSLPDYMIPRFFVPLDKIPITPNGKVDRKKLPEPGFRPGEAYVAPETETEEKLAAVWAEVLGIDKEVVGVESGFFELGGHSLSLIKMKAGIKEAFNMDIPVARLFQLPTIRAIASYIQGEETNRQVAEEILVESAASMETTLRLFEEFEDE